MIRPHLRSAALLRFCPAVAHNAALCHYQSYCHHQPRSQLKGLSHFTPPRHSSSISSSASALSSSTSPPPFNAIDALTALLDWVVNSGGQCNQVAARPSPSTGRAIQCTGRLTEGDTVIRVPLSCLLTLTLAKESEIGKSIIENGREFTNRGAFLSAFLLQEREKGTASPFHSYISTLPTSHSSPIYWSESTLSLLQGCLALPLLRSYKKDIDADYLTLMFASPRFTPQDFSWARISVSSRAFGSPINGVENELVMVPAIDLINHSIQPNVRWGWDEETKSFITHCVRQVETGEELYESYGEKCNTTLLTYYGFVLPTNPHNCCSLTLNLPPSDERIRMQKTNLFHLLNDNFAESIEFNPAAEWSVEAERMLSFLRLAHANEEETKALMEEEKTEVGEERRLRIKAGGAKRVRVIGDGNESRVWQAVEVEARRRLSEFRESLEEDEKIMKCKVYAEWSAEWMCVMTRMGEKRVLRWWLDTAVMMQNIIREGFNHLMDVSDHVDDRGLEEYRQLHVGPMLRWTTGSTRARIVPAEI